MMKNLCSLVFAVVAISSTANAQLRCETKVGVCPLTGRAHNDSCACFAPWGSIPGMVARSPQSSAELQHSPVVLAPKQEPAFQLRFDVKIDCGHGYCDPLHNPEAKSPLAILDAVTIGSATNLHVVQFDPKGADQRLASVPASYSAAPVKLNVPNEDSQPVANKKIANQGHLDGKAFEAKAGEKYIAVITVRPNRYNQTRTNLKMPPRYRIESISVTDDSPEQH